MAYKEGVNVWVTAGRQVGYVVLKKGGGAALGGDGRRRVTGKLCL